MTTVPPEDFLEAFDRLVERLEADADPVVQAAIGRVADRFGEHVSGLAGPITATDTERILALWLAEVPAVVEALAPSYLAGASLSWQHFAPDLDPVDVPALRQAWLTSAENRTANIGQRMWAETTRVLDEGVTAGEGTADIAARLREAFESEGRFMTDARATTITRTEVQSAVNHGTFDGMRSMPDGYRPAYKSWVCTLDRRTRDAHFAADGQTVPLEGTFTVNGEELAFPGDPVGSAENVINCRCRVVYGEEPAVPDDSGRQFMTDSEIESVVDEYEERGVIREAHLTAAASGPHTGAMIALVPTTVDAARLALSGFEPPEELHLTLSYLGEADDLPAGIADDLEAVLGSIAAELGPVTADGFAAAWYNAGGESAAWVIQVGGDALADIHSLVAGFVAELGSEAWVPVQRRPWAAHVTLGYSGEGSLLGDVEQRLGPVTFDRLRLAIAGRHIDFPLGGVMETSTDEVVSSATETVPDLVFSTARIRGVTLVDIPAFTEARIEVDGPADSDGMVPWSGVLAVEDVATGDGRIFEPEALRWEDPDGDGWPLRWDIEDDGAHLGSVTVGRIRTIERDGNLVRGTGVFDTNIANGAAAAGLVERRTVTGVSVDLDDIPEDSVTIIAAALGSTTLPIAPDDTPFDPEAAEARIIEFGTIRDDDGEVVEVNVPVIAAGFLWVPDDTVMTDPSNFLLPFADVIDGQLYAVPAGIGWASVELEGLVEAGVVSEADEEVIDAVIDSYVERLGGPTDDNLMDEGLVASAWAQFREAPPLPARSFHEPVLTDSDEFVHLSGDRIFGWVAQSGVCHDAFAGRCVLAPLDNVDLDTFLRQPITLDDGSEVRVGVLTLNVGHDGDGADSESMRAQFDNTRTVAAVITVGIKRDGRGRATGMWFSGVPAPWLSSWDRTVLAACRPSGHWRREPGGRMSLRAVLTVPVPGFPYKTASASVDRSNMALAASAVPVEEAVTVETVEEVTTFEATVDDVLVQRIAEAVVAEMAAAEARREEVARLIAEVHDVEDDRVDSE